jgi:ribosomal protein S18 acetylase RimI-like enzyme
MELAITVRPFCPEDFEAIVALEAECFGAAALSREKLSSLLQRSHPSPTLLAVYENRIVGFVLLALRDKHAYIHTLAVESACRRGKVGARLLGYAESAIQAANMPEVQLHVRVSNVAARALYGQASYVEKSTESKFYPDGEDAVLMVKAL